MRSDEPSVLRCLAAFGQPIHEVGFEAGALTQPIAYGLVEAGFDVVSMEARQVAAALSAMRNKTDMVRPAVQPDRSGSLRQKPSTARSRACIATPQRYKTAPARSLLRAGGCPCLLLRI